MSDKIIPLFSSSEERENSRYSELLKEFIAPFIEELKELMLDTEDIYELAVNGWNFGNLKMMIPEDSWEHISFMEEDLMFDISQDILNRLTDCKIEKFGDYPLFILSYEFEESGKQDDLSVYCGDMQSYLMQMAEEMAELGFDPDFDDEDFENAEFEEGYINRSALIVKPLAPFIEWLEELDVESPVQYLAHSEVYLISEMIDDTEKWLKKNFDRIFSVELEAWELDIKKWPKKRTYKMFKEWFQVETVEQVYDLEAEPVSKAIHDFF